MADDGEAGTGADSQFLSDASLGALLLARDNNAVNRGLCMVTSNSKYALLISPIDLLRFPEWNQMRKQILSAIRVQGHRETRDKLKYFYGVTSVPT